VSRKCAATLDAAKDRPCQWRQRTVLFLDEIHRFNRAQQDILLPDVENGLIILIGATTEIRSSPSMRRCQPHPDLPVRADHEEDITALIHRAINDRSRSRQSQNRYRRGPEAVQLGATKSDGDGATGADGAGGRLLSQIQQTGDALQCGQGFSPRTRGSSRNARAGRPRHDNSHRPRRR